MANAKDINEGQVQEDDIAEPGKFSFDTDFNVEDEFRVAPLVPNGRYEGNVTDVRFDAAAHAIVWEVTLIADMDVLLSDNETPVNGTVVYYRNWLPKAGDEDVRTKGGKMTKRQAKINMMQDFQKKMRINMNTPQAITEGVENKEWVGLSVIAIVEIREFEGRFSNQVKELMAS